MTAIPPWFDAKQLASYLREEVQELIILPTEKCNFRCTYCYEDFKIGKMPANVQSGIMRLLDRRAPTLKLLRLAWFGGEPLLAKDVMIAISSYAMELSETHGFEVSGGTTTNGYYLTRDLAAQLISLKQDFFQISLDGWEEGHDQTRKRADGRGTFTTIWENLKAIKALDVGFDCLLRIHMHADNLDSLEILIHEIQNEFGDDDRFRVNFQDIKDLGGATVKDVRRLEKAGSYEERVARLQTIPIGTAPIKKDFESESAGGQRREDAQQASSYVCYAARPNSLLIRANGRLGKCTVALSDDRNDIGKILPDGTVSIDSQKLRPWLRGFESLDKNDMSCPWNGLERYDQARSIPISLVTE